MVCLKRGVIFGGLGIYLMIWNGKVWEQVLRYDVSCGTSATCTLTFDAPSGGISEKLYVYYEIR